MTSTERPSLRDEQREATRRRILDACTELAVAHGAISSTDITFARVADLAGVSERTVYRLFPTKADLARAFLDEHALTQGRPIPREADELAEFLRATIHGLDAQVGPIHRPEPGPSTDEGVSAAAARERDELLLAAVRPLLPPATTDAQQRAVAGVLRQVMSVRTVVETAHRWDVRLTEAGDAHAWAVDVLVQALTRKEPPRWTPPTEP